MRKSILSVWIGLFWIATLVWGETSVPIMSSDEVERGMKGVGRTVFEGTKIEEFEVEILGVLKNWDPQSDLILARLAGKPGGAIDRAGLVIAGMSGSPVYIDGKLIGAVAYGWPFAKEPICGITPIEKMLGVFEKGLDKRSGHSMRHEARGDKEDAWAMGYGPRGMMPFTMDHLPSTMVRKEWAEVSPSPPLPLSLSERKGGREQGTALRPIATPLVLSGFCARVVEEMTPE